MQKINKAAVLGAGIMGSQIAAQLANAGIPSLLYDITQDISRSGLEAVKNLKPAAFYSPKYEERITPCNYNDHLQRLQEADWIIEVIVEKLELKRELFNKILPFLRPDAVISSNTSGLLVSDILQGMPESFARRFLITHFFNPPRYMHLLEIIPGKNTSPEVVNTMVQLGEDVLGKGIVYAKDTPNFVANRIGIFSMMLALKLTREMNLSVEEVDQLTGSVIGHPKSATFRTADLVGLDTLAHVAQTSYHKALQDEARQLFQIPEILQKMLANKWLGAKTGKGFYQKVDKEIYSLDLNNLQYEPPRKVRLDGLRAAKREWTTAGKIRALSCSDDPGGKFTWELLSQTLLYSANRIPEITDNLVNIDNALKWGYGWELGPFETWEALGLERSLQRMSDESKQIPAWVKQLVDSGKNSFYQQSKKQIRYFDLTLRKYQTLKENTKVIRLNILKNQGKEFHKNWNASAIDLGEGIALVEFHSIIQPVMNPLDGTTMDMISETLEIIKTQGFKGLVVGHQGQHFSVGANIALILKYAEEKNWTMLENLSKTFQDITQKIRFSPFPVVAAPFGMCLGGGFELIAACHRRVASAELYCGLVEAGVGLIPGAGGNLRLLLNDRDAMAKSRPGPFPVVQKVFETIGFAKVSTSAKEAVFLGYLRPEDKIVINPEHLIFEARQETLKLAADFQPPAYEKEIYLPGEGGRLAIEMIIDSYQKSGTISPHDALIGKKLAYVLTGGEKASPLSPVDEQYLLDIERDTFVKLCAEPRSQQRMAYMLKSGKPLRN
ncbi:MAG: hypothetical protein A2Y94_08625 [Caldithrix sp. RBG_13_44_9]|nr:MAG: hypothetical protein A2Y94_08625 [Caldithrix sp. RBG_13_44_9]